MPKQQEATFRAARPVPPHWAVRFDVAHPPKPGEFMLADLGEALRTVLFPAKLDDAGFEVLVPPGHPATRLLPGAHVDMIGPLGRGWRFQDAARLLLVAEVAHLPPLMPLFTAAPSVALILEVSTRAQLPALDRIPPTVELTLVTRDGSQGYLGPLESEEAAPEGMKRARPYLVELLAWTEHVGFSLERERYPAMAALVREARLYPTKDFAQVLVNVPMPCGVGACEVCRVKTARGEKHACTHGPVFDLMTLVPT